MPFITADRNSLSGSTVLNLPTSPPKHLDLFLDFSRNKFFQFHIVIHIPAWVLEEVCVIGWQLLPDFLLNYALNDSVHGPVTPPVASRLPTALEQQISVYFNGSSVELLSTIREIPCLRQWWLLCPRRCMRRYTERNQVQVTTNQLIVKVIRAQ